LNKRISILYFISVIIAGIVVACCGEHDPSQKEGLFLRSEQPYSEEVIKAYSFAKMKDSTIHYFVKTSKGLFFLTRDKSENGIHWSKKAFGLIDSKGNQLLPQEYGSIGNPGFISEDYVEIQKNDLVGLYNYNTRKLIEPKYEIIYPSDNENYIAIGQKGKTLFKLFANGIARKMSSTESAPSYSKILKKHQFNNRSTHFALWIDTSPIDRSKNCSQLNKWYSMSSTLIAVPSYIHSFRRDKLLEMFYRVKYKQWISTNLDSMSLVLRDSRKNSLEGESFITSYFESMAFSRGENSELNYLSVLNKKNHLSDRRYLSSKSRFINENLIEEIENSGNLPFGSPYYYATSYNYYKISKKGKIHKQSKGIYPMSSLVVLTEEHLKGVFIKEKKTTTSSPIYPGISSTSVEYIKTDHLQPSDLEYMIYEIYARHGMKFKNPYWSKIFKKYKWYKSTYSVINERLSSIEKQNIIFLREMKTKLLVKP